MRERAGRLILLASFVVFGCEGQGSASRAFASRELDLEGSPVEVAAAAPAPPVITRVEARFVPPLPAEALSGPLIVVVLTGPPVSPARILISPPAPPLPLAESPPRESMLVTVDAAGHVSTRPLPGA